MVELATREVGPARPMVVGAWVAAESAEVFAATVTRPPRGTLPSFGLRMVPGDDVLAVLCDGAGRALSPSEVEAMPRIAQHPYGLRLWLDADPMMWLVVAMVREASSGDTVMRLRRCTPSVANEIAYEAKEHFMEVLGGTGSRGRRGIDG
ncbi:MAG: hypothetical protein IT379_15005 [Deltaproteobacteria bacterium]|nr:hypothetical protein [Deltaproteobacteria bacterium]